MVHLGMYVYSYRGIISGPLLVILMGRREMEGKTWVRLGRLSWLRYFTQDHPSYSCDTRITDRGRRRKEREIGSQREGEGEK